MGEKLKNKSNGKVSFWSAIVVLLLAGFAEHCPNKKSYLFLFFLSPSLSESAWELWLHTFVMPCWTLTSSGINSLTLWWWSLVSPELIWWHFSFLVLRGFQVEMALRWVLFQANKLNQPHSVSLWIMKYCSRSVVMISFRLIINQCISLSGLSWIAWKAGKTIDRWLICALLHCFRYFVKICDRRNMWPNVFTSPLFPITGKRWRARVPRTTGSSGWKGADELHSHFPFWLFYHISIFMISCWIMFWNRVSQDQERKESEAWMASLD